MPIHPDAGKPVAKENLTDIAELVSLYYETQPDVANPDQQVAFGTSGFNLPNPLYPPLS
jgi:phosphoglucomutase